MKPQALDQLEAILAELRRLPDLPSLTIRTGSNAMIFSQWF